MSDFSKDRMTTKEAADYLGMSEGTIENWRYNGLSTLPFYKVGGRVYYRKTDIDKWLEGNKRTNTTNTG